MAVLDKAKNIKKWKSLDYVNIDLKYVYYYVFILVCLFGSSKIEK